MSSITSRRFPFTRSRSWNYSPRNLIEALWGQLGRRLATADLSLTALRNDVSNRKNPRSQLFIRFDRDETRDIANWSESLRSSYKFSVKMTAPRTFDIFKGASFWKKRKRENNCHVEVVNCESLLHTGSVTIFLCYGFTLIFHFTRISTRVVVRERVNFVYGMAFSLKSTAHCTYVSKNIFLIN